MQARLSWVLVSLQTNIWVGALAPHRLGTVAHICIPSIWEAEARDAQFKAILYFIVSSRPVWGTGDPIQNKRGQNWGLDRPGSTYINSRYSERQGKGSGIVLTQELKTSLGLPCSTAAGTPDSPAPPPPGLTSSSTKQTLEKEKGPSSSDD